MSFSEKYIKVAHWLLPSPFSLAILLTFVTVIFAMTLTHTDSGNWHHLMEIGSYWSNGFWNLLTFAMQMMLILVLGHALALTKPVERLIHLIADRCTSTARAACFVTFTTIFVALLNWGLGLIFGAILARKIGEFSKERNIAINYPLIAACGYSGLMVWHGGLSGSATLKVTESNHFLVEMIGQIPLTETIFSGLNLTACALLLIIIPLGMYFVGKASKATSLDMISPSKTENRRRLHTIGAEKLDDSKIFCRLLALCFLGMAIYPFFQENPFSYITLNYVNFVLIALGLWLLGSVNQFSQAIDDAITGASGIMIQFPLYAGIAGIMHDSGLIHVFSDFIINVATQQTYAIWTLFSAAVVNIFVPSGGGQWAVQGPILAEAATQLDVSYGKAILAFAYGDQLTNMMQPFWALPLLGITKLRAQDILPYTLVLMLFGTVIFVGVLFLF